jgi:hypothetical protein
MRGGVAVAVAAAVALLVAALVGMESAADRQPSAEVTTWPAAMPVLTHDAFEDPPSVPELDAGESRGNPVLTR